MAEIIIRSASIPEFTGRDVPISEIAKATGKSERFLKRGLREGIFTFGYVMMSETGNVHRYFCPDKLVWEKLGYFNLDADASENNSEEE